LSIDDFEKEVSKKESKIIKPETSGGIGFSASIKTSKYLGNGFWEIDGKLYREIPIEQINRYKD
jgi:hypothetical protein